MPIYTLQIPQTGLPNSTEDPKVASSLTTVQTALSAGLDTVNLSSSANIALTQLAAGVARFSTIVVSTSATLTDGQAATCSPGATVTLPSASAGAWCAVVPGSTVTGASPVTVQRAGSDVIYTNSSTTSVTSLTQGGPLSSLIFYAYASGSWVLVAGGVDSGWLAMTLNSGGGVSQNGTVAPSVRVVGTQVLMKGQVTTSTAYSAGFRLATVSAAAKPVEQVWLGAFGSGATFLYGIDTSGNLTINTTTSGVSSASFDGYFYYLS